MSKKKVVFLTNIPAPYTIDFFNELTKYVDLTVAFERKSASNREKEWYTNDKMNFAAKYLKGIKYGEEHGICFGIFRFLRKNRKNSLIVVGNYSSLTGIMAILYMRLHKIQYYIHADGGMISSDSFLKKKMKSFLISKAKGCFSPSKMTDDFFKYYGNQNTLRYPFTSIRQSAISKNLTLDEKREKRKKIYKEEIIFLYVGSLIDRKGVDVLLNSAKMIHGDYGIYVIGGTPPDKLRNLLNEETKEKIHFIEFQKPDAVLEYMKYADVFILPTRKDIWGLVVNEALSQGLPVIVSDQCVAGIELIRNDYNGYIFPSENCDVLANKMQLFINNPDVISVMRGHSINVIEKYTIESMAEIYYNLLTKE